MRLDDKRRIEKEIVEIFRKYNRIGLIRPSINFRRYENGTNLIEIDCSTFDINYRLMYDLSVLLQTQEIDINRDHYAYDSCSGDITELIITTDMEIYY